MTDDKQHLETLARLEQAEQERDRARSQLNDCRRSMEKIRQIVNAPLPHWTLGATRGVPVAEDS